MRRALSLPLVLLLGAASCASPRPSDSASAEPAPPSAFRPEGAGWSASVPALRMTGSFDRGGARFHDADGGELHLRALSWGRAGALRPLADVAPRCAPADCDGRIERVGAAATEWWRAHDGGFSQGFTLSSPPAGSGALLITLSAAAEIQVWPTADGADLVAEDGSQWRYAGLQAWDASGAPIAARMTASGGLLTLSVDVGPDAAWPITVDPVVTTASSTLTGSSSAYLGQAVEGADVNNDGYSDLIVSAYRLSSRGVVYVYHGSASGIGLTPNTTLYPATSGYDGFFGWEVKAGDFNGDGYDDVVVSEPEYNNGTIYVFMGSSAGLYTTASVTMAGSSTGERRGYGLAVGDWNGDHYDDLVATNLYRSTYGGADVFHGSASGLSTTVVTTLNGGSGQYMGYSADSAGDTDNDGYDDFVVSHYAAGSYYGKAWVYRGASTGISASRVTTITGPLYDTFFGRGSAGLGDVNGDGYDDIGVGATGLDVPYGDSGGVYIYYGSSTGVGTAPSATLYGRSYSDRFGWSLDGVGDTNGDGYDDVVIGAIQASEGVSAAGAAYVIPGSASGLSTADQDVVYAGSTAYENYGSEVAGVGDIDGDGFMDVGVGHPGRSAGVGSAYLYLGTDGTIDDDGDGYYLTGTGADCDDSDPAVHPGATEVCDGLDQDCDGSVDEGVLTTYYADLDSDGYGDPSATLEGCALPSGYAANGLDCDDGDASVSPADAEIVADGIDQDCDGAERCYLDADHDGAGRLSTVVSADLSCTAAGEASAALDCDDDSSAVHPGAPEVVADGVDQDCDGGDLCYVDDDGDGHGATVTLSSPDLDCSSAGESNVGDDCDDSVTSTFAGAPEAVADGVDQDCDGKELCYVDADGDGDGAALTLESPNTPCDGAGESTTGTDCDDADALRWTGAEEVPLDGRDSDCDGLERCLADEDVDGFGAEVEALSAILTCDVTGVASVGGDCDDSDPAVSPAATEVEADGLDGDCDGFELCWIDEDGDGHGLTASVSSEALDCDAVGLSLLDDDCDDTVALVYPGAAEVVADGVDQDCDGGDTCYADADGDGYGSDATQGSANLSCVEGGEASSSADCDDASVSSFPGAAETCNEEDDNCDGNVDEGLDCEAEAGGGDKGGCSTAGTPGRALPALVGLLLISRSRRRGAGSPPRVG